MKGLVAPLGRDAKGAEAEFGHFLRQELPDRIQGRGQLVAAIELDHTEHLAEPLAQLLPRRVRPQGYLNAHVPLANAAHRQPAQGLPDVAGKLSEEGGAVLALERYLMDANNYGVVRVAHGCIAARLGNPLEGSEQGVSLGEGPALVTFRWCAVEAYAPAGTGMSMR